MSEMIERVVAAMKEASYVEGLTFEQERRHIARAAIKAMRDPTDEMMQAMYEAMFVDKWDYTQAPMVGAGFEAAIDAALSTPSDSERK